MTQRVQLTRDNLLKTFVGLYNEQKTLEPIP